MAQQNRVGLRRMVAAAFAAGLLFAACSSDTGLDGGGGVDSSIESGIPVEEVPVDEAPAEDAPAEEAPAEE